MFEALEPLPVMTLVVLLLLVLRFPQHQVPTAPAGIKPIRTSGAATIAPEAEVGIIFDA